MASLVSRTVTASSYFPVPVQTFLLLLPDFSLIVLGLILRRSMQLGDHFWSGVERLVYFILFPALLLNSISKARLDWASMGPLVCGGVLAMGAGMVLMLPLLWRARRYGWSFASFFQCGFRFNTYIGLAAAGLLLGNEGVALLGMMVGVAVPVANLAAVWALAKQGGASVWREIGRNPLIWATLLGLLLNVLGWLPPKPVQQVLGRLAEASIALGLLTVGAALRLNALHDRVRWAAAYTVVVKLLLMPLVTVFLGVGLGVSGEALKVLILFAALPTASSAYILAMRMGGDGTSVAWLISCATLASMLTLPLWGSWMATWTTRPMGW